MHHFDAASDFASAPASSTVRTLMSRCEIVALTRREWRTSRECICVSFAFEAGACAPGSRDGRLET
jgi:hypothetical protein